MSKLFKGFDVCQPVIKSVRSSRSILFAQAKLINIHSQLYGFKLSSSTMLIGQACKSTISANIAIFMRCYSGTF